MRDYPSQRSGVIHVNGIRDPYDRTYWNLDNWLREQGTTLMQESCKVLFKLDVDPDLKNARKEVRRLKFERHCQLLREYFDKHDRLPDSGDKNHPSYWWIAKVRRGEIKDRWGLLEKYKLAKWVTTADYQREIDFEKVCVRLAAFVKKHGRLPTQREPDGWFVTNLKRRRPHVFLRRKAQLKNHGLLKFFRN